MIPSSLLIKICGVVVIVGSMGAAIGIPVENAKWWERRSESMKKPEILKEFFKQGFKPYESDQVESTAFQDWNPEEKEKVYIATNFSSINKHMPNEFFSKLQNQDLTKASGVCHIKTYNTTVWGRDKNLYIPVLKSEIKSSIQNQNVRAKGSNSIEYHEGDFLTGSFGHDKYKEELQKIINSAQDQNKVKIATDLLMLQTRYEETISRLVELGNIDTSLTNNTGLLWTYGGC